MPNNVEQGVAMGANVHDVAAAASVSIATVSRVLNGTAGVSEPVRKRVMEEAERLGYQPAFAARSLRRRRTNVIGLVLPQLTNPFFPAIIGSVNQAARDRGYRLLISVSDEPEAEASTLVQTRMVDGLLVSGSPHSYRVSEGEVGDGHRRGPRTVPTVALDRAPLNPHIPLVTVDHRGGARLATEHLLDQQHASVAHIGGPGNLGVAELRQQGFLDALASRSLAARAEYLLEGDFTEQSGFAAAFRLAELEEPPSAVFCANDMMAIGAIRGFQEAGLTVPQDVAIVGFDGLELTRYVSPALTTVAQPVAQLADLGVQMLLDQVEGEPTEGGVVVNLPGRLVVRESSRIS